MTARGKAFGAVLITLTLAGGLGYAGWQVASAPGSEGPPLDLGRAGSVLYVDDRDGRVRQVAAAAPGEVLGIGPACQRAYAAGGTLACLRPAAIPGGHEIAVYDAELTERKVLRVWGTPSRTRVSASGKLVAWTVFRSGDAYLFGGGFSTTAGVHNLGTGEHYDSLEEFESTVDGKVLDAADRNFWGITFAADDRTFYATMASGGRTWLMRGDLRTKRLESVRDNAECPSLSPDGTRLAYKKRVGEQWRLHVLGLATGVETALAETANVDDQPAWLDAGTIGYARSTDGRPTLHAVPADGSGAPRALRSGSSPAALAKAAS
ncbi:TolB family protein [Crossiella cryophila]|uniref:WD40-like Beta Propeller Repeat n=1 Tax=Crossiella cryophila TaxID=43355 RepID=A0A7W7CF16_9PSEU|nr:PD40 domain-containing protein [Crossiella cryophila]MBB4679964.1 hypothetical protein [Crossiella cryophila]